jgi:hypothetical protein
MVEPELFQFVVDGDVINWGMKGGFATGKIPIKELGAGVSDESCLVISFGEDIFLESGKIVSEWEAASEGGD